MSDPTPTTNGAHTIPASQQFLQVIDGDGHLGCSDTDLSTLVASTLPSPSSTHYSLVGIMGAQSGGKSTLLNLLFGTQFRVMDSSTGRGQTTKGVWVDSGSPAIRQRYNAQHTPPPPSVIVMDLEGTDSGERGEDRTTFERQTSLFALALSNLLILNMWEHDIGRYTASNYGILKTIFEVNLTLFSPDTHTHLLFLIRDHIEDETPLAQLQTKLRGEVDRIWSEIQKPDKYRSVAVGELFVFHFAALPHMKLQKAQFSAGVDQLRDRFLSPASDAYFYKRDGGVAESEKASVPADAFGLYVRQIWETIASNKELNLPSQKEMLATYRCDEIIHQSEAQLQAAIAQRSEQYGWMSGGHPNFGQEVSQLVRQAVAEYDQLTLYYHPDIVGRKRLTLLQHLEEVVQPVWSAQMAHLVHDAFSAFATSLSDSLLSSYSNDRDIPADFPMYVSKAQQLAVDYFDAHTAQLEVAELEGLQSKAKRDELTRQMEERMARERTKVLSKVDGILEALVKQSTSAPLTLILKKAEPSMWDDILALHDSTQAHLSTWLQSKQAAYRLTPAELHGYEERGRQLLSSLIRSIVEQHSSLIVLHMRKRFDRLFRYDEDGFIRKWRGSDDVRARWKECITQAQTLLELFSQFRLPLLLDQRNASTSTDDSKQPSTSSTATPEELTLISDTKRAEIELDFPSEVEGALREAETEQERIRESRRLPAWGLALIAFLGFDELMAILRNPLLMFMLVVTGGGLYVLYSSGMLGPAQKVAMIGLRRVLGMATEAGLNVGGVAGWLGVDMAGDRERRGVAGEADAVEMSSTSSSSSSSNGGAGLSAGGRLSGSASGSSVRQRVHARQAKSMTIANPAAVAAEIARAGLINRKGA